MGTAAELCPAGWSCAREGWRPSRGCPRGPRPTATVPQGGDKEGEAAPGPPRAQDGHHLQSGDSILLRRATAANAGCAKPSAATGSAPAGRRQAGPGRCHERRWMEGDLITRFASSKAAQHCNYSGLSWRRGGGGLDLLLTEQPQEAGCPPAPGCSAGWAPADTPNALPAPQLPCPAPQHPHPTILPPAKPHPPHPHPIPGCGGGDNSSPPPPRTCRLPWSHTWCGHRPLSQGVRPPRPGPPTSSGTRVRWAGDAAPRSSCMRSSSQSRNSRASCCALPRNCELCLETMFCKRRAGRALSLGPRCPALTKGRFVSTHCKNAIPASRLQRRLPSSCLRGDTAATLGTAEQWGHRTRSQDSSSVAHHHGVPAFSC